MCLTLCGCNADGTALALTAAGGSVQKAANAWVNGWMFFSMGCSLGASTSSDAAIDPSVQEQIVGAWKSDPVSPIQLKLTCDREQSASTYSEVVQLNRIDKTTMRWSSNECDVDLSMNYRASSRTVVLSLRKAHPCAMKRHSNSDTRSFIFADLNLKADISNHQLGSLSLSGSGTVTVPKGLNAQSCAFEIAQGRLRKLSQYSAF